MNKKYVVKLTDEERQGLETLVNQGKAAARKINRAWILLKADAATGPAWSDPFQVELVDSHNQNGPVRKPDADQTEH